MNAIQNDARDRVKQNQAVRKRRVLMTIGSYLFTYTCLMICYFNGILDFQYTLHFLIATFLINGGFYLAFHLGWNLKLKDHNLTEWQIICSVLPAIYVLYFIEDNQARSALFLIAIIPLCYGILDLDTRRFIRVGLVFLLSYVVLICSLIYFKEGFINFDSEVIQAAVYLIVVLQMALIGGFISNLRASLKRKNNELNKAVDRIGELLNIDELTGVNNRRFLMQRIDEETKRSERKGTAYSVCLLDIDFFKKVNDTHGHLAGDEVLKNTAQALVKESRSIDCFGRYGGEEFLMILPETSLEGAIHKAEKMRKLVKDLSFSQLPEDKSISISIGVTSYRPGESIKETLARADDALYKAKEDGRNKVVSFASE
ncbi:MAG: GGDEF domain-containing protein [Pseudomonadota bacterium]